MRLFLLALAAGCALLQVQAELPDLRIVAAAAATAVAIALAVRKSPFLKPCALLAAGLACGFAWAALMAHQRMREALPAELEGRDLEIIGVVASLPQYFERGMRFEFTPEQVLTRGARLPSRVQLSWYGAGEEDGPDPQSAVHPGERWRLTVRLKRAHGGANPHGFDYEAWLLERGVLATGYVRPATPASRPERLDAFVWGVTTAVDRIRDRLRDRLENALADSAHGGVIVALAIGDQRAIDGADWQLFTRTGVGHLMSISGLHVTMIASLAAFLFNAGWRRSPRLMLHLPAPRAAALAGVCAAFAYCLLAGFGVPAQRTLYMLCVAAWAIWRGWFGNGTRVLALALGLVCLLDPWAPLSAGFWLSFGAVAILMLAAARVHDGRNWMRDAVAAQFAVTVGLLPLTIALFQQVSLVGPIANAVAIPVVSLVVTPIALLACALPVDAVALAAHWPLDILCDLLAWMAAHEWAVWQRAAAPAWTVALAIAGSLWMLVPLWWHWRILGALWMLPLLAHPSPRPGEGDLWLTVLDVGQGLAVVARTREHALLFDAGPRYSPEADGGNRVIVPFLRGEGVTRLDTVVLSHDDADHTGGARSTIGALQTGTLHSPLPPGHPARAGVRAHVPCSTGLRWSWDQVEFEYLHPGDDGMSMDVLRDNARSCVLAIRAHGRQVLLPADIERDVEARLVAREASLASDILVVPHHGSRTSSTAPFLDAVRPSVAVISAGYRNRFRHPAPDVLARYGERGVRVWRTDLEGAVQIDITADGIDTSGWRDRRPRYWHAR